MRHFSISSTLLLGLLAFGSAQAQTQKQALSQGPVGMMISFDQEDRMKPIFKKAAANASVVDVNLADVKQEIRGFGATLTQASVININRLKPKARRQALEQMFSKKKGYGLDSLRVPIGATDFSDPKTGNFTYDDTPNNIPDPELKYFSMAKDAPTFALLREILAINPEIRLMLSPWTAPAWMKESKTLQGGWLEEQNSEAYANYLLRVVAEYQKMGFKIDSLTMVNEPGVYWAPFTCMGMAPDHQGKILAKWLGPGMRKLDPSIKLLALDHNWGMANFVGEEIEKVPEAKPYIDGIAFHCYGGGVEDMSAAQKRFGVPVYQTECSPYEAKLKERRWYFGWWINNQVIEGGRNGATTGMGWNIALDEYYGPHQSFCRNCRGLISVFTEKGVLSNEYPELRALGLGAKYTGVGTHVVGSTTADKDLGNIAYRNKGGSKVVVLYNKGKATKSVLVRDNEGGSFSLELPVEHAVAIKY